MKTPSRTLTFTILGAIALATVVISCATGRMSSSSFCDDKKFCLTIGKGPDGFVEFNKTDPKAKCKFDLALKKLGEGNYRIRHLDHEGGKVDDPYIPTCKGIALKTDKVTASELAENEPVGDPHVTQQVKSDSYALIKAVLDHLEQ
jgi:hypothetical protein